LQLLAKMSLVAKLLANSCLWSASCKKNETYKDKLGEKYVTKIAIHEPSVQSYKDIGISEGLYDLLPVGFIRITIHQGSSNCTFAL
jgi:hypothetical protein